MSEEQNVEDPLETALKDLEAAEEHLEKAHADEVAAEREVKEAITEVEVARHGEVTVHVVHVHEVEHATFREKRTAILNQVWAKSYTELKIQRQAKDIFQTDGEHPKSLMNDLNLTLEQAVERKVIENYHFGIASETGGA